MNTKVHSVQMIVFDWAGTTVDFGSRAPLQIFEKTFQHFGLEFTLEEIAGPMGMEKKDHIRTLLSTEEGTTFWKNTQNRDWDENDVERIYDLFEANLKMVVQDYSHRRRPGGGSKASGKRRKNRKYDGLFVRNHEADS